MASGIRLLLVDDEMLITEMLHEVLEDAGYEAVVAGCGRSATVILDDPRENIAGLVTDINMGSGPSGWDVARHARLLRPALPVIYMTGAAAAEWTAHGVPRSVLVNKPFAAGQMVAAIAILLNAANSDAGGLTATGG